MEYGDGWAPIFGPGIVDRVRAFTEANPGVPVVVAGVPSEPAEIEAFASAGTTRAILGLGAVNSPEEAEPKLEELRRCVETAVG